MLRSSRADARLRTPGSAKLARRSASLAEYILNGSIYPERDDLLRCLKSRAGLIQAPPLASEVRSPFAPCGATTAAQAGSACELASLKMRFQCTSCCESHLPGRTHTIGGNNWPVRLHAQHLPRSRHKRAATLQISRVCRCLGVLHESRSPRYVSLPVSRTIQSGYLTIDCGIWCMFTAQAHQPHSSYCLSVDFVANCTLVHSLCVQLARLPLRLSATRLRS